ncbi:MAG: glycerol-3-phosphate dehydrogenase [Hyphomicrobiaceae bacterium]
MYDILVIGGGVNGCGIARDAAGRGLKVLLAERADLASGTSSASTKLIHGGLRYLEHYEFRLVREALAEREVLLAMAPHIAWPLRFVLPHHGGLRPRWMIRLGLFLYDHLGGRRILPGSRALDLSRDPAGEPLRPEFRSGFEYSDCWVDDARLVVLNAMDARARGAEIRVATEVTACRRVGRVWQADLRGPSGGHQTVETRVVVNAAGPWVGEVVQHVTATAERSPVRLVKGSHIVVPRLFEHERAYIFQNADRRIVFAIPYEGEFTLIGTTDVDFAGDPSTARISGDEVAYLCRAVSAYFEKPVAPEDVVWTYAGVRPLYDDGTASAQEATRDYVLALEGGRGAPRLLNVFGGKITTYRHLAEEAVDRLADEFARIGPAWTVGATLPGGDFEIGGTARLADELMRDCVGLDAATARRLARSYGTQGRKLLAGARRVADLGRDFGAGLTEREVTYLVRYEWARNADDVLWRRSKLGLRLKEDERQALRDWLETSLGGILAEPEDRKERT